MCYALPKDEAFIRTQEREKSSISSHTVALAKGTKSCSKCDQTYGHCYLVGLAKSNEEYGKRFT